MDVGQVNYLVVIGSQNFQKSFCLKLHCLELSYLVYTLSRGPLPKLFKLCPWGPSFMAPLWPLTFSSGERPRALWAVWFLMLRSMNVKSIVVVSAMFACCRYSARCSPSSSSRTWMRWWSEPTTRLTAWLLGWWPRTSTRPWPWPTTWRPAVSGWLVGFLLNTTSPFTPQARDCFLMLTDCEG